MDRFNEAIGLLPADLKERLSDTKYKDAEEIRLRCGNAPAVFIREKEEKILNRKISLHEISLVVEKACGASLQAHLHEIKNGYINYKGLRIGVCGEAIYSDDKMKVLRNINSINIRIPHEFIGDVSKLITQLQAENFQSTLIISPPGYGKTSLLRELTRQLSSFGKRVAVVDERNELACVDDGKSYFFLGEHCDYLTGVKKAEGAMMLLRGMSPDIIAFDEISRREDVEAIFEIAGCGVELLATAHGRSLESIMERPLYRGLLNERIFKNLIFIERENSTRSYYLQRINQ